ncbi:MAG TPA: c-type cytochrome [Gaiellaceae bacterium]|jgi:mono/diheme cytochrome c family protein
MLFALATGNKIALAVMGGIFVSFALASAFLLPRRNPNFPGRALGWFVLASIVLFLAMIGTVLAFGKEKAETESAAGESAPPAETTTGSTAPTETAPAGGGAAKGDPAAGKEVFETAGCNGCHTLKAANATGNIGPNLDQAKPSEALIRTRVEHGKGAMPAFGDSGQLSKKQIDDVVAFVYQSTH